MYKTIVVGTDGSGTSSRAVQAASELARLTGATLHLVSAYRAAPLMVAGAGPGLIDASVAEAGEAVARETATMLNQTSAELAGGGLQVETHAAVGEAADAILDVAERCSADLIVVGSKGMTGARHLLGSVPNRISHRAATAVLIVKTT